MAVAVKRAYLKVGRGSGVRTDGRTRHKSKSGRGRAELSRVERSRAGELRCRAGIGADSSN